MFKKIRFVPKILPMTILFGMFLAFLPACSPQINVPERGSVSWLPGSKWEEALLTGNGTIGAMVIGRPHDETIILNHALLYLPASDRLPPINQVSRLDEIRQLLWQGKYAEAAKIPVEIGKTEGYQGTHWTDPYMPALNIRLDMKAANVSDYARAVDFTTGETTVFWRDEGGRFERKLFVSRADNCIVMSIKGSGKINTSLEFAMHPVEWSQQEMVNGAIEFTEIGAKDCWLTYRCKFRRHYDYNPQGYEAVGRVILKGGNLSSEGNQLVIQNADEILLLVRLEPNFDWENSRVSELQSALQNQPTTYKTLLERHVNIHGNLYNRVKLDLGGRKLKTLQSEVLVARAREEVTPPMIEKFFDAARYNILCATGTRPPNLQGIWNGTWSPPWSSDFTNDGNAEVAISSLLCGNLPELMLAYFDYHEKLLPFYEDNARRLYGCRGIHIPSRTSSHGWDIHFGETWCLTFWTAGAGWVSSFFYDYFLYTGDTTFLKERAYPFMKAAAQFYEDFLTIGENGKYVFNPSYSPENNPANSNSQACINATMDVMVAKQLLRNCIQAAKILKVDESQAIKWQNMLSLMPEYEINEDGALREWLWPGLEDNYNHRHVSHLYGLYEMLDPDIAGNPELIKSAKNAIAERMKIRRQENGGAMVFGLVQMALVAANLGDAEMAEELINWMASYYWSNSLASLHDPGNLFNMDLSGGFPAAVIRMLVYSEPGMIKLLPALPNSWPAGSISGVLVRGQIEIKELKWQKNQVLVTLQSRVNQNLELRMPRPVGRILGPDRDLITRLPNDDRNFQIFLPADSDVTVKFVYQ